MNKLYVDPKHEPELLAHFGQQHLRRKAPNAYTNTQVVLTQLRDPEIIPTSTIGRVPNGLADSRGFIVTETTAQEANRQKFDEDALDQWNRSRLEIEELARRRRELAAMPLATPAPDQFVTTSQRVHVDLLPAADPDSALRTQFKDIQGRGKGSKGAKVENPAVAAGLTGTALSSRSTGSAGSRSGTLRGAPEYALEFQQRETALNDVDALRTTLHTERQRGVELSRNGTTGRVDECFVPAARKGAGFVVELKPTSRVHGDFDGAFYSNPDLFPESTYSPDEEAAIREVHERRAKRGVGCGTFATTHVDSFQDRTVEADADAAHRKSHYFDRKQGTMQMPKRGNDPLLRGTNTQREVGVAEALPNAYTTTAMAMNQHFRKY